MNIGRIERLLGVLGALCGIIVFTDQYFWESKLASALLIPLSIPTGFFAILLIIMSAVVLAVGRKVPVLQSSLDQSKIEAQELRQRCERAEAQSAAVVEKLRAAEEKLRQRAGLRDRIIALLATNEFTEMQLLSQLGMSLNQPEQVQGVIGELVREGVVEGGSLQGYYRLARDYRK